MKTIATSSIPPGRSTARAPRRKATNAATSPIPHIKRFYQRKQARTNGVVAIKAVAHKLARACYYILRDQVAFDVNKAFA